MNGAADKAVFGRRGARAPGRSRASIPADLSKHKLARPQRHRDKTRPHWATLSSIYADSSLRTCATRRSAWDEGGMAKLQRPERRWDDATVILHPAGGSCRLLERTCDDYYSNVVLGAPLDGEISDATVGAGERTRRRDKWLRSRLTASGGPRHDDGSKSSSSSQSADNGRPQWLAPAVRRFDCRRNRAQCANRGRSLHDTVATRNSTTLTPIATVTDTQLRLKSSPSAADWLLTGRRAT
uniref:Uncharacterized protein n=1 Tax=Plectus sambesii TaxID=2011161 RepID=A0A914WRV8_9BILA